MGRSWFESKDASRKFVDLIYKGFDKMGELGPPQYRSRYQTLRVMDIFINVCIAGRVLRRSQREVGGRFKLWATIYDLQSDDGQPLFADPPEVWPMVNEYKICSTDVKWREFNAAPNM